MAIRTEDSQVLKSVVGVLTIDMVEFQWESSIGRALCPSTNLTLRGLEAAIE
ncbi:MAG: hypothetical protein Q8R16_02515 [bacterium]|nr:hypothetical protein [bacterium]